MTASEAYSKEFKEQAVALATVPNASVRGVARDLGVRPQTLEYWVGHPPGAAAAATASARSGGETDDPVALRTRPRESEARVRQLEVGQEILKKATALFARGLL